MNKIFLALILSLSYCLQGRVAGLHISGYGSNEKAKYEAPKIEFEKIKVSAEVSVKYILK
ncbi:hypothetical protein [Sphingobacterium pedocola]|uniref:SIMPL domain-containing protein n=1 Tax=Sphingobacterium pedocola TaxID=2082722 RepID=A0ABR9T789_9SPHI|nr:hypothetical protein [Sphingobacterium pedocola]MBE8721214.1 hypothetical protein [Sphingobacterium pedocola]